MRKLEWKEDMGVETMRLGRGLVKLVVAWCNPNVKGDTTKETGYRVSVNGVRLKALLQDVDEAKDKAVSLAVKLLEEAVAELIEVDLSMKEEKADERQKA